MIVEVTRSGADEPSQLVFRQTMTNVRVVEVKVREQDGRLGERVTLAPQQVSVLYKRIDPATGAPQGDVTGFVNCAR